NDCKIIDLHLWSIGPNIYSAIISVLARSAKKPEYYKKLISPDPRLVHLTVEVNESSEEDFSE
ncbi:cation transporter, partial [Candidatus Poribacteria bacterium]